VSRDITRNALIGVGLASIAILIYIAFAFRNTPPPVSPWSFGATAIVALLHDALFLLGIFAILGHFFGVQVDALFVTAILTVIGFSVHDTIVVYDRSLWCWCCWHFICSVVNQLSISFWHF
jgi:preprotein translocase subunit SecF